MACWSDIEGTWSYKDLIGSRFRLKHISISHRGIVNKYSSFKYSESELTLKEVYFRVTTDGKVQPLFRMEEIIGKLFFPNDLELLEISKACDEPKVCGTFITAPKSFVGNDEVTLSEETINPNNASVFSRERSIPNQEELIINKSSKETGEDLDNEDFDDFIKNINNWDIVRL